MMEQWLAETFDRSLKLALEAMYDLENARGKPVDYLAIEQRFKRHVREVLIFYDNHKDQLRQALGIPA